MDIIISLRIIKRFIVNLLLTPLFIFKFLLLSFRLLKFSYVNKKDSKIIKFFRFLKSCHNWYIEKIYYERIKPFYRGLINLYRWFNIIWKDRYWDHSYFLCMTRFKLTHMEKEFRKCDWHTEDNEKIANSIKEAIRLLDEWEEDEYNDDKRHAYFNHVRDNILTWWN